MLVLSLLAVTWLCARPSASAELVTGGNYRIRFSGSMMPTKLPRAGSQPISYAMPMALEGGAWKVGSLDGVPLG